MEYERLVAIGGHFDGKLMPPTVAGLSDLKIPIRKPMSAMPISEMPAFETYTRGEIYIQEKTFAFWLAKDVSYSDAMQRLLNRYAYER